MGRKTWKNSDPSSDGGRGSLIQILGVHQRKDMKHIISEFSSSIKALELGKIPNSFPI